MSHSGLSYSHPSYSGHHPSSHTGQSSAAVLPAASYPATAGALHQSVALPEASRSNQSVGSHHHSMSQQQMLQSQQLPNVSHQSSTLTLPLHLSTNNNSNLYPQSSVYINPYMTMPSPSSHPTHGRHHHIAAQYHQPAYITPPAAFNVHSQPPGSNDTAPSSSVTGSYAPPYTSSGTGHLNAGLVSNNSGALVPYTHQPYQPQPYPPLPPPQYASYRVNIDVTVTNFCSIFFW